MTSHASVDDAPLDGAVILDRYRLDALLDNTRAWAELWLGQDLLLNRTVVVRLLDSTDVHTAMAIEAAQEAAGFDDARCVRVLDIAVDADLPERGELPVRTCSVVVRAWVDGSSLGDLLHDAPMDPAEAADLIADVAEVIARAHAAGLSHAALDPQHVLLTRDGDVAVLDLGIAAVLHADDPRVLLDPDPADPVDVRSLGALLYACLTGRWPLATPTPLDAATRVSDAPDARPVPPRRMRAGVPSALDALCRRALGETVGGEPPYDDARAFAVDVRRWLGRAGLSNSDLVSRRAATGAGEPRVATTDGRSRAVRWVVGTIVAAFVVGIAVLGIQVLDGVFGEPDGSPPPGPSDTTGP